MADCKRTHLPELRICAFHLNSYAFNHCITTGKEALAKILATAVADQVDVIVCDANIFANRHFRQDRHSTLIKANEYLKHLNHLDFCLKSSDEAYHHPFQCNFSLASRPQDPAFVSEVKHLLSTEGRRTKERPSGEGKIGGNPLPLPILCLFLVMVAIRLGHWISRVPKMVNDVQA